MERVPDPWHEEAGDVERLSFFSDAVFAIAMTLLVVDLARPDLPEDASAAALREALLDRWPEFLSYVTSFVVIGIHWSAHYRLMRWIARADRGLVWRNLAMLLGVAFVPYTTAVLSDHGDNPTAVVFYAGTLAIIGGIWWETWRYVVRRRLTVPGLDRQWESFTSVSLLLPPLVFAVSIPIALAGFPELATISWILIAVGKAAIGRHYRTARPMTHAATATAHDEDRRRAAPS